MIATTVNTPIRMISLADQQRQQHRRTVWRQHVEESQADHRHAVEHEEWQAVDDEPLLVESRLHYRHQRERGDEPEDREREPAQCFAVQTPEVRLHVDVQRLDGAADGRCCEQRNEQHQEVAISQRQQHFTEHALQRERRGWADRLQQIRNLVARQVRRQERCRATSTPRIGAKR